MMNKLNGSTIIMVVALLVVLGAVSFVNAFSGSANTVIEDARGSTFVLGGSLQDVDMEGIYGASGTRWPNGISADTTSPNIGEVRGTTLAITSNAIISGLLYGNIYSTTTDAYDFTLTAAQSGSVVFLKGTGATTTLPAVTNTGARFIFSVQAAFATNNFTVASAEGDNINGSLFVNDAIVVCAVEDKIQFIADGEQIGDFVELVSDGTNWNIVDSRGEGSAKLTCTDPS